mgnify:CR=1 FL=1
MSEIKVNKISPRAACGTVTLGDSGDTFTIPAGATITNNGTANNFGADGAVNWQTGSIKTSTFTAVSGEGYFINSGSSITANLPAGSPGAIVAFSDYARNFATYNLLISPDGSEKIGGTAADAALTIDGQVATFVYVDSTKGWINVQNAEDTETGNVRITATGGTITTVCTNFKVHTFTGPGTFQVTAGSGPLAVADYLVIAGGGGGGIGYAGGYCGGGGGAGGYRESKVAATSGCWSESPLAATSSLPLPVGTYPVTVGGGGAGKSGCSGCGTGPNVAPGVSGTNSIFSSITSAGGGGGGSNTGSEPTSGALDGGSGGGGARKAAGGSGNSPPTNPAQGSDGGTGHGPSANNSAAGGGGAGAVGANVPGSNVGGNGGAGVASSINASPVTRAGGGGGSGNSTKGTGGTGGGGDGALNSPAVNGVAGTANTGGGGGGGTRYSTGIGATGGSGLVIIRYKFQ